MQWQLQQPLDAVIFDCDGTLSKLEGINVLAVQNDVGDEVNRLTEHAMAHVGITESLYSQRLSLTRPTRSQVEKLGHLYFDECVSDIKDVIAILQHLGKSVFIMSAGIKLAVDIFAEHLNVPKSHVYSVEVDFDQEGNYQDFNHQSPLANSGGKGRLIEQLKKHYPSVMHVGDGANDLDAKEHVARFVGYGGVFFRESIRKQSDFYICSESLAPILALALTRNESEQLSEGDRTLYDKGVALVESSEVMMSESSCQARG